MKRFFLLFLVLVLFTGTAAAEDRGDYEYSILADGTVCVDEYSGEASKLTIPAEIDGKTVTAIGNDAFFRCDSLTTVTIPGSVTSIGDNAFYDCESLTEITIPNSVREVGKNPFECTPAAIRVSPEHPHLAVIDGVLFDKECQRLISYPYGSELSEYAIPQGIRQIGDDAFAYCDSLTAITIPDSVTAIGNNAFACCKNLTAVTIPDSVQKIGANPFERTPAAIRVSPEHPYLAVIDGVLFDKENKRLISYPYGNELSEYAIPQGIRQIGDAAFAGCESLTAVTIPDSVTSIEAWAFSLCNSLTAITIPDSVTFIGDMAFFGCESLTAITIPESVTTIGFAVFASCKRLTAVTIPSTVTTIGDSAFAFCDSLTEITIPDSVTSIGAKAFAGCMNLKAITIPDSVTSIRASTFYMCDNLTLTVGRGSYAAQYCKDNALPYQYSDALDWLNE